MSPTTKVVFSADAAIAEAEMRAILFALIAFAHIDGEVDVRESGYIHETIDHLVKERALEAFPDDEATRTDVMDRWRAHFYQAVARMDHEMQVDFSESVTAGETATSFVYARLKLRCFELLEPLEPDNRLAVLGMIDALMHADGKVHPAERAFREELFALLEEGPTVVQRRAPNASSGSILVDDARELVAPRLDHPFLASFEQRYPTDAAAFAQQASRDIELITRAGRQIVERRTAGRGRLDGRLHVSDLDGQEPFLDGFVHAYPTQRDVDYELLVIGDLHGCYSCLKGAVLQADFLTKVDAYRKRPGSVPYPMLVLLGDYIDRGHFGYDGVLRTVLRLYLAAPDHVFVLRGNHEHYVERHGAMTSPVRPAEGIESIAALAPRALLFAQMQLFDALPSMLLFDRILFVHAGIPREDTIAERLTDLASLNDPTIRLQMAWSDPSSADFVPRDLQRANTRFPFGRLQFRSFMARLGCTTLIRGHERVVEGLRRVYADPDALLLSLFSSGGRTNVDLPEWSNYREVVPTALVIRHRNGKSRVTPFPIAYETWNDPAKNGLLRPFSS